MKSYFVKILYRRYDGDVNIFEASGIGEEALEIILSNYSGMNYDIKICAEVQQNADKWDRLYNYLNDKSLAIAPDERMDDEEKHDARIAYDTLQEIIEIMCDMEVNDAGNQTDQHKED